MMNQFDHLRLFQTADGSKTLKDDALNVTYRSSQGAQGESRHVFLGHSGLRSDQKSWSVFELGFGAGRNCWETIHAFLAVPEALKLLYVAVDHAPISSALLKQVFEGTEMPAPIWRCFESLFAPGALQVQTLSLPHERTIELHLHQKDWRQIPENLGQFDAMYHDPFGPQDNPDAWDEACFQWAATQIKDEGRLVTYAAAGHVRRSMQRAGFVVAKAPGFGQKREMTIAALNEKGLGDFKRVSVASTEAQG